MLPDANTHTVAAFWDFQFFPDTLPLLDGAKKAIGTDKVLATVVTSLIVILATPPGFLSEFLQPRARFWAEESNKGCRPTSEPDERLHTGDYKCQPLGCGAEHLKSRLHWPPCDIFIPPTSGPLRDGGETPLCASLILVS